MTEQWNSLVDWVLKQFELVPWYPLEKLQLLGSFSIA